MVLDTNVTASAVAAMLSGGRATSNLRCVELGHDGTLRLAASPALRAELASTLQKPEFGLAEADAHGQVELIYRGARDVRVRHPSRLLRKDEADNLVLDCALAASADFLVTRNLKDFAELIPGGRVAGQHEFRYRHLWILSPGRFLARLRREGRL